MITRYIQHLPKAILCCLLTIPCHAADDTIELRVEETDSLAFQPTKIKVPRTGTVLDLKQAIQTAFDRATVEQKLVFKTKELNDNTATLQSCGITQDGQKLKLTNQYISKSYVYIQYGKNKFAIVIEKGDKTTIKEIKQAIATNKVDCPIHQQVLVWNGQTLDDTKTIHDYPNLKNKETLQLTLDKNRSTKIDSGKDNNTQSNNIKLMFEEILGMRKETLTVPTSVTILDIKQDLQEKWNIPTVNQRLTFLEKPSYDDDNKATLHSLGITKDITVFVNDYPITKPIVNIKYNKKCFAIALAKEQDTTIQEIKEAIATNKVGCPVDQQVLVWNGQTLDDTKTIHDYPNLKNKETLQLTLDPEKRHKNQDKDNTTTYIIAATCILFILGLTYVVKQNPAKKDTKSQDTTAPPTSPPPTPRKPKKAPLNTQA